MKSILLLTFLTIVPNYIYAQVSFIENKGQIVNQDGVLNNEALFTLALPGMNVILRPDGFSYDVYEISPSNTITDPNDPYENSKCDEIKSCKIKIHRVDVFFLTQNSSFVIEKIPTGNHTTKHYYTAGTPHSGIHNMVSYNKIIYKDIFPDIDIEFIALDEGQFEYNFILHPGANINEIVLDYRGASKISLTDSKLHLDLATNDLIESIPTSFLKSSGESISVQYTLDRNRLTFSTHSNYFTDTLIIDPIPNLVHATYFGSLNEEMIFDSAVDDFGNIYLAGHTTSMNNIATTGSYQTEFGGIYDVLLCKFNASHQLVWSTYMGGTDWDYANAISIVEDAIFIVGTTQSQGGISSPGAFQENLNGFSNGFLSRFNTDGQRIWSSYLGTGAESFIAMNVVNNNELIVVGNSQSPTLPFSNNPYQSSLNGPSDGFFSKWTQDGFAQYCSFFGGESTDSFLDIVQDSNGLIWLSGNTRSQTNISTSNAIQQNFNGGISDLMLVAFTPQLELTFATYFGGTGDDFNSDLEVANSKILLAGQSNFSEVLATPNANQPESFGGSDSFYAIINENLELEYCSLIGGNSSEDKLKIVYYENQLFYTGITKSTTNLTTTNSYQEDFMDSGEANIWKIFLGKINSSNSVEWCTYFGNYGATRASDILFWQNQLILTGWANTTESLPIEMQIPFSTSNAYQPQNAGEEDGFIAYFDGATGIEVFTNDFNFKIYPNPTTELLNIQFPYADVWTIRITNTQGQTFIKEIISDRSYKQLHLDNLSTGLYTIVIYNRNSNQIFKSSIIKI